MDYKALLTRLTHESQLKFDIHETGGTPSQPYYSIQLTIGQKRWIGEKFFGPMEVAKQIVCKKAYLDLTQPRSLQDAELLQQIVTRLDWLTSQLCELQQRVSCLEYTHIISLNKREAKQSDNPNQTCPSN